MDNDRHTHKMLHKCPWWMVIFFHLRTKHFIAIKYFIHNKQIYMIWISQINIKISVSDDGTKYEIDITADTTTYNLESKKQMYKKGREREELVS